MSETSDPDEGGDINAAESDAADDVDDSDDNESTNRTPMRPEDEQYFDRLETGLDEAMTVAERAKGQGKDPEPEVEIPIAKDMADRVENILGIPGVAERVRELEGEMAREEAALELAKDFAEGRVGDYEGKAGKIEGAVRTAVALLTEGVVAAPIEGIDRVELLENDDGTEFVNVYYAGPIRSAGGTAQALSVLVADYTRSILDLAEYKARDDEIERYVEEITLYDKETGLQYSPKDKESRFIADNIPIMLDGEATGDEEVSGFRDLDRVDTNSARGGMCLVAAEGIALKAPKIQRYTRQLDEVEWPWLQDLIDGTIGKDGDSEDSEDDGDTDDGGAAADDDDGGGDERAADAENEGDTEGAGPPRVDSNGKYLLDLIAGRPVFGHPSESGGFRLRYGRSRNLGFATAGVHPATMHIIDDFLATGTQIKIERPGKAAGIIPVDSIEGPTVRLATGEVRRIDDPEEALELRNGVEKILDIGEYLVNYGEFVENNHPLAPASYAPEWWVQEFDDAGADVQALEDDPHVDLEDPSAAEAIEWATAYDCPLHPKYTYVWHDISVDDFIELADAVANAEIRKNGDGDGTLVVDRTESVRTTLETLLVAHHQTEETFEISDWQPLTRSLGLDDDLQKTWDDLSADARAWANGDNAMKAVNEVAPFEIRERAPTRIGARMGRPEKSEKRDLSPAVHTLFPITEAGGNQRDVAKAASTMDDQGRRGVHDMQIGQRKCHDCGAETVDLQCPDCGAHTEPYYECADCEIECEPDDSGRVECPNCDRDVTAVDWETVDLNAAYHDALDSINEREGDFEILKGVEGLSSANKTPEPMEKGILRAKHGVSSFKDGTVRYDMTDLPVTAVKPEELDVTADHFRGLGYETDIDGDPLRHDDQLVELKVQDIVLSDGAAEHMIKTADFVDDLLERFYGLPAFYDIEERDDLVGELVFGMAPHTSSAVVGRVIGFTSAAVGYAHPYFHAAKRRNCFHPETEIRYREEGGEWQTASIQSVVEERLVDPETDDFGTEIQELQGDIEVPSIDADGNRTVQRVEAVSKHLSTDHLLTIETTQGKEITVTPEHTMLRWEDGPQQVDAMALEVGDTIPVHQQTGSPAATVDTADCESTPLCSDGGSGVCVEEISSIQPVESSVSHTYCLTVKQTNTLVANNILTSQCDGDEDCVMLLMDGLLNFSRQFLPDQRGGSVAEDSRLVAVDPDGNIQFMTFNEFWNELDAPVESDGKFQKRTCTAEGWDTYTFSDDHTESLQRIEKAIRYPAADNEQLVRIETQFGRNLSITENHSLFRYDDGISEVAGGDLSKGDLIVAPRSLDIETRETTIDTVAAVDDPYVVIDDHVEELLTTAWETVDSSGQPQQAFRSGLAYRLNKQKIAHNRFERILDEAGLDQPSDVQIGLQGSSNGIARQIEVDEEFAWLLGLYVAEGSTSTVCPTIHNADETLIDRATDIIESTLDCEPGRRWSNDAYELRFPAVFREVLYEMGFADADSYDSSEKVIPDCIQQAPREVVCAFLRGFIAGDGSEKSDDNATTVAFYTTSDNVKDGLVFLLHRLGVVANISEQTDREGNRQDIYTITVSGGADDNPLRRILNGKEPYLPKSLVVSIPEALMEIRELDIEGIKQLIPKYLKRRENISLEKLREIITELDSRELPEAATERLAEIRPLVDGDLSYLRITDIGHVDYDGYLYDLQVGGEPIFTANWLYAHNSMDAPLVMSSRVDPTEIDDEAHNMDIVSNYPKEFYEATREMADPEAVDIKTGEDTLDTVDQYHGFDHTHAATNIHMGPSLSAYKTLGSMMDKMDAQLELARKLRAVDETDVAERVIEYHFLPDLIGNLRAFSRQETRCLDCGESYRRMPLSGECRECGGRVNLTVHEGSVNKYMDTAIEVAERFGCREYTKQRLRILERSLESVFENDKNKQSGIADFM